MHNLKKSCSAIGQETTAVLQRQGIQQLLEEQYIEAAASFKAALDQSPSVFKLYNAIAFVLISQGDLAQAAQYLEKGSLLKLNEAYVYSNLGLVYYELGADEKALINIVKALELNPEMVGLNLYLGYSYVFLNDHKKALEYLLKVEELHQYDAEFLLLLANSYQTLNQNDLASVYFEKSRQLKPSLSAP
jgi:type IV pilus assembly protein PilF